MLRDEQVRLLRKQMTMGMSQESAAAQAGMSVRSARKWKAGLLPSETKTERTWRTREDPFEAVWEEEIVPLLQADAAGILEAVTLLDILSERRPGAFASRQLMTLQRRVSTWRAQHGPPKLVKFPQVQIPGREASVDFTDAGELGVTIAGEVFRHLLFHFVLPYSGWKWVGLAFSETFEALQVSLQAALWELGGVPAVIRSDNLPAATRELERGGRTLTKKYVALLNHYGAQSTRITPGESHENGSVEKTHHLDKSVLAQRLLVRGSADFPDADSYMAFVVDGRIETPFPRLADCLAVAA